MAFGEIFERHSSLLSETFSIIRLRETALIVATGTGIRGVIVSLCRAISTLAMVAIFPTTIPSMELKEQSFTPTLARNLGDVPHVSGLLRHLAQTSGAGDALSIGCSKLPCNAAPITTAGNSIRRCRPDSSAITDEEIGIALCLGQHPYDLDHLRAAAQLLSSPRVDAARSAGLPSRNAANPCCSTSRTRRTFCPRLEPPGITCAGTCRPVPCRAPTRCRIGAGSSATPVLPRMADRRAPTGSAAMNNPLRILQTLDRHLTAPAELTLFGRAALALGYPGSSAAFATTQDVDAILPLSWLAAEDKTLISGRPSSGPTPNWSRTDFTSPHLVPRTGSHPHPGLAGPARSDPTRIAAAEDSSAQPRSTSSSPKWRAAMRMISPTSASCFSRNL